MPRANLNRDELKRVTLYFELLQRYQNLEAIKMLPLVAVRTICIRRGYGNFMAGIERYGEDMALSFCRDELREMARLWAYMVHEDPPPTDMREGVINSIKMTRDAANNVEVMKRTYALIARCAIRERWLRERKKSGTPKPQMGAT